MKHLVKIYAFIFLSIAFMLVYMYFSLERTKKQFDENINKLFILQAKEFTANLEKNLKLHIKKDVYLTLKKNKKLRDTLAEELTVLTTDTYKYVYILYRDLHGDYRFLVDADKPDKGEFDEKLNVNKKVWNKAFHSQKPFLLSQKRLDGLWISYIVPVVIDGKTEAMIGVDFSSEVPIRIRKSTQPLDSGFEYIFIAILIMLLTLLYQTILNFKTKKDSILDPLTGAFNRNYLRDLLKKINIAKYQIIMLDIDHFKKVNDSYGHKIGDNILHDVSAIVKETIRSKDIFVRFGGEEFLVFVQRKKLNDRMAKDVAERIRKKIQETTFDYEELSINITVSMGVTCTPEHFKNSSDAIKHADEMLYIAKKEGRDRVICSDDMHKEVKIDTSLHFNEIQEAIEHQQVICHYQAIFNTKTKKVDKYEALVRIKREDKIIYPNDFIPKLMHTNLYNQLTKIILETVFTKIKENQVKISVNLNFSDILNNDIFAIIIDELEQNRAFSSWLIVELLEYELIESNQIFSDRINIIKAYGVKIAIDDFGTGFANYNVFQTIPIDIIKIDASLIKNIDHSEVSRKIVHSIVVLTKELGIETVAEFVHSKEVMKITEALEVDRLQGFYLSKPQENLLTD